MDAINACNERYIKQKMRIVRNPEAENSTKRMEPHIIVGESKLIWELTCKTLLESNISIYGVKLENKYSKRDMELKIKKDTLSTKYGRCVNGKIEKESC